MEFFNVRVSRSYDSGTLRMIGRLILFVFMLCLFTTASATASSSAISGLTVNPWNTNVGASEVKYEISFKPNQTIAANSKFYVDFDSRYYLYDTSDHVFADLNSVTYPVSVTPQYDPNRPNKFELSIAQEIPSGTTVKLVFEPGFGINHPSYYDSLSERGQGAYSIGVSLDDISYTTTTIFLGGTLAIPAGAVEINGGAATAYSKQIQLNITDMNSANPIKFVRVTTDPDDWPYNLIEYIPGQPIHTFLPGYAEGISKVFVEILDANGHVANVLTDEIFYSTELDFLTLDVKYNGAIKPLYLH